jgi:hypothetical protein
LSNIIVAQSTPIPNAIGGNIDYARTANRSELLSGVEINQNQIPASGTDFIIPASGYAYQYFSLPTNYQRAGTIAPDITGVQICVNATPGIGIVPAFNYLLQVSGTTISGAAVWTTLASGTVDGIHSVGTQIWADVYFSENVTVTNQILNSSFRIGINTSNIGGWWYSRSNPYPQGYGVDENGNLLPDNASFMFRLLSYSADSGTDWLNDNYRSVVFNNSASNVTTVQTSNPDSYWLSGPNPSKYAVEVLYFDISDSFGNPQTIDKILLHPITPGPVFHVYYSSDGAPVTDAADWDNKMWIPVPKSYRVTKRETFALPTPVTANYIALEFSRLQAQYYAPGAYQQPVIYRKFPQWIYNYFLAANPAMSLDYFIPNQTNIIYDKLQFMFDYYLDDLQSQPLSPDQIEPPLTPTLNSNQVSPSMLVAMNMNVAPYTLPLGINVTGGSLLSQYVKSTATSIANFPLESLQVPTKANSTIVSSPNRDQIVNEENQPNLYFFINCRHNYQMSQAEFEYDRAYFVGLRSVAFLREDYGVTLDRSLYVETAGDNQNTLRNDFVSINGSWQINYAGSP